MKRFFPTLFFLVFFQMGQSQDFSQSPWHLQALNPSSENYFGVTLANGMIGLVSSATPLKVQEVVLNGVYDNYQRGKVSNILQTFNHLDLDLQFNGQSIRKEEVADYRQVLDMREAVLVNQFRVEKKALVRQEIRALRHLPFCALSLIEVTALEDLEITPLSYIHAPDHLRNVHPYFSVIERPHIRLPMLSSKAESPSGKWVVAASSSFLFEETFGNEPMVIHEDHHANHHWMKFRKTLKKGETYRFGIVGASISSAHSPDALNEAERLTIFGRLEGKERLVKMHKLAWDDLWKGDIEIEGDLTSQKDVRAALYHLYSFSRAGTSYSMSPMGLSGLGYNGHVFWDTELWMYPPLLLLQPEISKSLLRYRSDRMEAARMNAMMHGYKGVMFPWESSESGFEDTPVWALTGPFQHHITADVGWAFWKYYELTQDKNWLRESGYPMLREVADFWTSRVERNGPGQYDINNVIGANEHQENIDNNAFTNGIAKTVLVYASLAAQELGAEPNPDWMHVAANIPVLKFANGVTRENATYSGEIIKQADVNLLAFPLKVVHLESEILKDLQYYESRYDPHGPAMGISVLATLYARLGQAEKAFELFQKSYKPNEIGPFGVLAEMPGGQNPYFATGAGAMLQTVLFGFGGLELDESGLHQLPSKLPKHWKSLKIKGVGPAKLDFEVSGH